MKKARKYIALLLTTAMVCSNFSITQAAGISETETEAVQTAEDVTEETNTAALEGITATEQDGNQPVVTDKNSAEAADDEAEADGTDAGIVPQTEITGDPVSLMKGENAVLTSNLEGTVTWASADDNIATVNNGTVTGAALGKTTVTATDGNNNTETFEISVSELQYFTTNIFDYKESSGNSITEAKTSYDALEGARYLDDLLTEDDITSGWGSPGIGYCGACGEDTDIGIIPDKGDTSFVITYEKGISMHADGNVTVTVPEGVAYFSAVAAVNQCQKDSPNPSMTFKVTVKGGSHDGDVYNYVVGNASGFDARAKAIDIDVTGATSLKLEVSKATENPSDDVNYNDHGVWADAKFTTEHVDQTQRMGQRAVENNDATKSINDYTYEANNVTSAGIYFTGGVNKGTYTISGNQNHWTGENGGVVTNIAKAELNGSAIEFEYTDPGLFTLESNSAKDVFTNVQFPFVADPQGYYTFDSTKMDAAFNDDKGANGEKLNWYNSATEYTEVGQTNNDKTGFFPFNDSKGKAAYTKENDAPLNYWFGMSMAVDFYMLNGGYMDMEHKEPIIFEFSGDDDVWVYIDGKLVMDLGGIHDMASGSINFGEDKITVTPADGSTTTDTVSRILGPDWVNDDGIHSLQVFYLERGKGASNLKIKFNLPQKDQLVVEKMYDNTAATGKDAEELLEKEFTFQIKRDENVYKDANYALFENGAMIDKNLKTDTNGQFNLKYGQRAVFSLKMPRAESHTYDVDEIFSEEGFTSTWATSQNNVQTGTGAGTDAPVTTIGAKPEYQRTNVDVYTYTFHNYRNTVLKDDTVVIDYGKEIDVDVFKNDELYASRTVNLSDPTDINGKFTAKNDMVAYTPVQFMDEIETTRYNVTDVYGQTKSATVTVIPATTVYYEDDFPGIEFSGNWQIVASESTSAGKAQDDGTVGEGHNYGYDSTYDGDLYYSGGSSHYIQAKDNAVSASFTFKGTGFDIISRTDNETGVIRVVVTDDKGNKVYSKMIDTLYQTEDEVLYQIPIINYTGMDYGEYKVTISVAPASEYTGDRCTFYLDAIRLYDPLGNDNETANAAYAADKENDPYIKEIRNLLIEQGELSSVDEGFVYVDLEDYVGELQQYIAQGPNNEVYLKDMDAVCTTLTVADGKAPDSVQLGVKAPNGTSYIMVGIVKSFIYNEENDTYDLECDYSDPIKIGTATDMYYDITDLFTAENANWSEGVPVMVVSIGDNDDETEDDSSIASLTYLKTTGKEVNCQVSPQTLSLVSAFKQQLIEEEKFDTLTIYSAKSGKTTYSRLQNMVLTVVTSNDITGFEIRMDNAKQKILKTVSTDNGDGTITWNLTVRASSKKGTNTYKIYAVNDAGEKSEPATLTISTK